MMVHADIRKGETLVVRVSRQQYRGRERIDIREYFEATPGDTDTLRPTRKGVSLLVEDIPALRAALQEAEIAALQDDLLELEDYTHHGLDVPPQLREAA